MSNISIIFQLGHREDVNTLVIEQDNSFQSLDHEIRTVILSLISNRYSSLDLMLKASTRLLLTIFKLSRIA
jgi:hypothetical protein